MSADIADAPARFVAELAILDGTPGISLDAILERALSAEKSLRRLFAQSIAPDNPYIGLIDLFDTPYDARRTRPNIHPEPDFPAHYIFPVRRQQRKLPLSLCTVNGIGEFKSNWNLFTHGILSNLDDWTNLIVAGGSVLACLNSIHPRPNRKELNDFYLSPAYRGSDIDIFIWGLTTADEARAKMLYIFEAVSSAAPWPITCVRKSNVISIHTVFPFRPVQIVLRLYSSPAEVLAGFDVDSACCAFDGERVWVNPRSLAACIRQTNTIDITRRSPSYELRLAKYAERGFEIFVPSLSRQMISSTIYDPNLRGLPNGLARLIVLEELFYGYTYTFTTGGMLQKKHVVSHIEPLDNGDLHNNYDFTWAQIPYGQGWDAGRIAALVKRKDQWLNFPGNPYNAGRRLHRHAFCCGTMDQCVTGTFCQGCPAPENQQELEIIESERGKYIRGAVSFMVVDPGRQLMTGSFNPIDTGEWEAEAYQGIVVSQDAPGEELEATFLTVVEAAEQFEALSIAADNHANDEEVEI